MGAKNISVEVDAAAPRKRFAPLDPHTEQYHSPLCRRRRWEAWMPLGRPSQGVWRKTSFGASRVGALWQAWHRPRLGHQVCALRDKMVSNRLAFAAALCLASADLWCLLLGP